MALSLSPLLFSLLLLAGHAEAQHAFNLTGDIAGTHDPSIIKQGAVWYVFSTGKAPGGGQIPIRTSTNLTEWVRRGQVFSAIPAWIAARSPDTRDLWAPDISFYKGEYRLYYAYSLFGKNTSGIGLATNRTLNPQDPHYKWIDKGPVLSSTATDNFNAIDPNFVADTTGRSWLAFGSFWSGIKLRRLAEDGKPSAQDSRLYSLASRRSLAPHSSPAQAEAIEAPFIVHRGEYFYLFVSWDLCCRGIQSTYRTMAGRSKEITGPYLDREGVPMLQGGGTELLTANADWLGPGGASVLPGSPDDLIVFHAYSAVTGKPALHISTLQWLRGWPRAALSDRP